MASKEKMSVIRHLLCLLVLTILVSSCTCDEGGQDSWAAWAQEKVVEGLGPRQENAKVAARQMREMFGDAAKKAKDKISDVVPGDAKETTHSHKDKKSKHEEKGAKTHDSHKPEKAKIGPHVKIDPLPQDPEEVKGIAKITHPSRKSKEHKEHNKGKKEHEKKLNKAKHHGAPKHNVGMAYESTNPSSVGNSKGKQSHVAEDMKGEKIKRPHLKRD
ncbi:uncharacterized protein A4U43_C05F13830 [Asparagus officinalis]|uniref:Uncharacterized protein n=1 Tax=Asparagus officinalis TaxID=4686 RepID=A0A5P1EVT2_ASPOF|nr:late embryogenesis abundant protein D-29-like [Asparagus officinalis]ONK68601.1 uncharacterized protein A4U43_C05F13830 [Asparagus officinalis]